MIWNSRFLCLITQPVPAHAKRSRAAREDDTMRRGVHASVLKMKANVKMRITNIGLNRLVGVSATLRLSIVLCTEKNGTTTLVSASQMAACSLRAILILEAFCMQPLRCVIA